MGEVSGSTDEVWRPWRSGRRWIRHRGDLRLGLMGEEEAAASGGAPGAGLGDGDDGGRVDSGGHASRCSSMAGRARGERWRREVAESRVQGRVTGLLLTIRGCQGWPTCGQGTMDACHGSSAPVTGGGRICQLGWAGYCC